MVSILYLFNFAFLIFPLGSVGAIFVPLQAEYARQKSKIE